MAELVSRAAFARTLGLTAMAITKWAKGAGAAACVGKRIDAAHPVAVEYARKHGVTPTTPAKRRNWTPPTPTADRQKSSRRKPASSEPPSDDQAAIDDDHPTGQDLSEEDVERYEHLSLRVLKQMFGGAISFRDWLDGIKKIVDIKEKQLKNAETEGRLTSRELVATHVFGAIESSNRRLLGDAPKTIARRLYAMARAGSTLEDGEQVVREIIGAQLRTVKSTAIRLLRVKATEGDDEST